jgi:hypothetical protein
MDSKDLAEAFNWCNTNVDPDFWPFIRAFMLGQLKGPTYIMKRDIYRRFSLVYSPNRRKWYGKSLRIVI